MNGVGRRFARPFAALALAALVLNAATPSRAAAAIFRSIDGTGNNPFNYEWGSTGQALLRIGPSRYADGIDDPAGSLRPGARLISNTIAAQTSQVPNDRMLSAMVSAWGQFLLSDVSLTAENPDEPFDIPVPGGDPTFDPFGTGT